MSSRVATRPFFFVLFLVAAGTGIAAEDVVLERNAIYPPTIRDTGGPPCPISRAGAMLNVAIYDAVNSVDRTHEPYAFVLPAAPGTSAEAAAAAAGHTMMLHLYPARAAIFDAAYADQLAAIPDGAGETDGVALGESIARMVIDLRSADGTAADPPYSMGSDPGDWRPTFPDFTGPPFNPGWGETMPWTMSTGNIYRPVGPAGFTDMAQLLASPEYAAQVNEVKELGARNSASRTEYETETAWFWANDRNGTFKPPGHLNYISEVVSLDRGLSLAENARLFALISIAMADAGLVAWDAKYGSAIDLWRPISAIREAASDGNDATEADPEWEPLNPFTPPFPAFISGHATFGAVHAAIMEDFFGSDEVTFTMTSDDTPGVFRTYTKFSDAAKENGRSRIFLGVHYSFDATDGYVAGTALGHDIVTNHLRPLPRFIRGDANGSGDVDISDAVWNLNYLFLEGPTPSCIEAAEANDDDRLDISDALYVISHQFLGGEPPPAPFPDCGSDPKSEIGNCGTPPDSCS